MRQRERNWSLGPFTLWRADWGDHLGGVVSRNYRAPKRKLSGATITDDDNGLIYQAVIERANGRAHLTGITILTTRPGQRIDQDTIRRVPVQRIAEQVSLHLADQESSGMAVFASEAHRSKHDGPSVEDVARDHRTGLGRQAIATKWLASVHTVDKRLREARDLKLIDLPTTGRPRDPKLASTGQGQPKDTTKRKRDNK